jgi:hypothetical protein
MADRILKAFSRMELIFAQPGGWVSTISRENPNSIYLRPLLLM